MLFFYEQVSLVLRFISFYLSRHYDARELLELGCHIIDYDIMIVTATPLPPLQVTLVSLSQEGR